jgi:hypothetical protein
MVTGATAGSTEQKLEIVKHMQALLNDVWRIKWENGRKEVYWRLVGDGFPKYTVGKCVCGVDHQCSRRHVYWDCCVAQGVLSSINAALSQIDADNVSIENVWLMRPPRGVQEGVWMVVCLAALAGMEQGNRVGCREERFWESLKDSNIFMANTIRNGDKFFWEQFWMWQHF